MGLWVCSALPARAQDGADLASRLVVAEWQVAEGDWRPLALPARWPVGQRQRLQLRASFEVDTAPQALWALRFNRLPADHEVRVNGHRVSGAPPGERVRLPRAVVSTWIDLPPALLRPGRNTLELSLHLHGAPAGLSAPWVGPADALRPDYRRYRWLGEELPYALNLAVSGLALFTLGVWGVRRSERMMGFFGLLVLLVSVRNLGYYTGQSVLPAAWGSLLFWLAQGMTVALLGTFALLQTTALPAARVVRSAALLLALYALAGTVAAWLGHLDVLRAWLYPLVIVAGLASVWRMWRLLGRLTWRGRAAVLFGLALVLVCAVQDYLFVSGRVSPEGRFWLPYLTPLLMGVVALQLLRRFVGALDLAERHGSELEGRVAERTRDLQAANAAKTRFVAAASHDLRQPVASIGLLAGLLREQPGLDAGSRGLLDRLMASVQALERLLKGLLDLSRFEAGSVRAQPRVLRLSTLFDAVASHEQSAAQARGLQLRLHGGGLAVHTDPVLLEQIVRNLVSNAVRYTERGGVLLSARRRGDDQVLLQVWDTGIGIPAARQAQVFEEFVQLDNPARDGSRGLGLGLSLVRRAAEVLQAPLSLRSQPGRGSCFSLLLPLAESATRTRPGRPVAQAGLEGRRVLVVDDDDVLRETLRLRLERWGLKVQAYGSVRDLQLALGRGATPRPPDLLISDQRLPDGDSRDVVDAVTARHPEVPVLVITGDTAPADLARLSALGWPVLHKPFGADELFAAVRDALGRR